MNLSVMVSGSYSSPDGHVVIQYACYPERALVALGRGRVHIHIKRLFVNPSVKDSLAASES